MNARIDLPNGLDDLLRDDIRRLVETQFLPAYVRARRWFASKDQKIETVTFGHISKFATRLGDFLWCEVDVQLPGRMEKYQLPIGIAWNDDAPTALSAALAIAPVDQRGRAGVLTDAVALDALPIGVIDRFGTGAPGEGLSCVTTARFDAIEISSSPEIRRIAVEQSNTSIIVGSAVIMKLIRRVAAGINPEVEMVRHLTLQDYANTPPLLGEVVRVNEGGDAVPQSLIVAQEFVPNHGDAWAYTLEFLNGGRGLGDYAAFAGRLGTRLGELHAVLARPSADEAFAPVLATAADALDWARAAEAQIDAAMSALDSQPGETDVAIRDAAFVLAHRREIIGGVAALAAAGIGCLRTRIHGDFHLGQILVTDDDAYIIDFEGEPSKPLSVRRAKTSPLRDVAGLLRSFDYAAASVKAPPDDFGTRISASFMAAYREVERNATTRWVTDEVAEDALLDLFLLEKSAYEICYEAANRPSWLGIPLRGFADIAARVMHLTPETPDA